MTLDKTRSAAERAGRLSGRKGGRIGFALGGRTEHVVFCHFVGSRALSYRTAREPPWYAMFTDLFERGLWQRQEQLFVRISSNRPLAEFRELGPVRMFVQRLRASYLQR